MGTTVALAILIATTHLGATIPPQDIRKQEQIYERYWGVDFSWKFEELPEKGSVAGHQMPYSGYIYPDNSGGTIPMMRKYDRAFHQGRMLATAFEEWDVKAYKAKEDVRGPLLGLRLGTRMAVPDWSGHCNGWTAAAIRHAEPQQNVIRNGVVFTPSDIKGLLSELYIYNDIEDLSGSGRIVNAGVFHAVVTNWLGRGQHGIGMEADPGEEKWNYPIYAYNSDSARRSPRHVEVKLNLGYLKDSNREYDESPKILRVKYFHYLLELNSRGEIVGGRFYPDSSIIAMLWMPLQPKPGRQPGNELGNPHLNVENILSIWRDSVPEELRQKWVVVDPPPRDRHLVLSDPGTMVPVGYSVLRVDVQVADAADETPLTDDASPSESEGELTSTPENAPIIVADRPGLQQGPAAQVVEDDQATEVDEAIQAEAEPQDEVQQGLDEETEEDDWHDWDI